MTKQNDLIISSPPKKNPLKSKINLLSLQITQNTEAIFPPLIEYITIFAALWA